MLLLISVPEDAYSAYCFLIAVSQLNAQSGKGLCILLSPLVSALPLRDIFEHSVAQCALELNASLEGRVFKWL